MKEQIALLLISTMLLNIGALSFIKTKLYKLAVIDLVICIIFNALFFFMLFKQI